MSTLVNETAKPLAITSNLKKKLIESFKTVCKSYFSK